MSKARKDLQELLTICYQRGISESHLGKLIQHEAELFHQKVPTDSVVSHALQHYTEQMMNSSVEEQLEHLLTSMGRKRLHSTLMRTGGLLDAIAKQTSDRPNKIPD